MNNLILTYETIDLARDIAERVPMVLVSTSYRLAPENQFPAGLEDCVKAYKWVNASCFPNLSYCLERQFKVLTAPDARKRFSLLGFSR
jgi:hypothetical protein